MRLTLSALAVSVGLAVSGLAAQAAPVSTASPLGASATTDVMQVQYRREMRRREVRREIRRERRAERRDRRENRTTRRIIRSLTR